jgi:anti-anti-sigma factor
METTEAKIGEIHEVTIQGHLDTASSQAFEDRLVRLVEGGVRHLLLECSGMGYVNSSGLKAILVGAKQMDAVGGKFVVCGLVPSVYGIFEMIGFTRILSIYPTREEALRQLQPDGAAA